MRLGQQNDVPFAILLLPLRTNVRTFKDVGRCKMQHPSDKIQESQNQAKIRLTTQHIYSDQSRVKYPVHEKLIAETCTWIYYIFRPARLNAHHLYLPDTPRLKTVTNCRPIYSHTYTKLAPSTF